ncbi:glycosyltransferase [Thermoflexus sp.]|uniref:glycosyltransferase n=1 Tax=Thermoflexus sp. TaxID=1969742 RepID=UPI00176FB527|nr:glycosyltransferase [Thermoflexus sp.]
MHEPVAVPSRSLEALRPLVEAEVIEALRELVAPLRGLRVLHVNATAFGGGVAEILATHIPLLRDLGLEAEWRVIHGDDAFFRVTKAMHNGLQGMDIAFTPPMQEIWKEGNRQNAMSLPGDYDVIVIHDPQPVGIPLQRERRGARFWIWRCHIDTSNPNRVFWSFLLPYLAVYDAAVFTMAEYVGPGFPVPRVEIIPPTIDPLSPKNAPMDLGEARAIVARFGVDVNRPLLLQVSRFDPWKDPLGVIDAYRLVKEERPEVQLALVGSMAHDDPEGWFYYDRTLRHAGEDPDLYVLHNFHGVGAWEVNAFQRVADVVIQKSLREGFGLTVTEALWKGKPVVGGRVGGIPLQVLDGETGFLVSSVEECAGRALELLNQPEKARAMGERGREHVRQHFLCTRGLRDELMLLRSLLDGHAH